MIKKNESQMDRAIRLLIGLVLLFAGYQVGGWLMIVFYVLGIIALLTAATGVCFLYKIFGLDTAKSEAKVETDKVVEPETMAPVEPEEETVPTVETEDEEPEEEAEEEAEEEETTAAETKTETPIEEEPKAEETTEEPIEEKTEEPKE